jgi:hypothetical protein
MTLLPPHRAHPRRLQAAAMGATCPCRRTARGTGGKSPELPAASLQKPQACESRTPSHQPHWGFLLSIISACAGKEGERSAPPLRRAGKGRSGNEEPGARSREQGPELRKTIAGVDIYTAGSAYIALNIFATPPTTPSRPRLHRRPTVSTARPIYSPPLGLFPVMNRRRRDASPVCTYLVAGHRATGLPYRDGGGS